MKMRLGCLALMGMLLLSCGGGEKEEAGKREITAVMDLDSMSIGAFCQEGSPAILSFGGKRCISCLQMRENFEELRTKQAALRVGYVYWEDSPELFEEWDIGVIPVQIVIDANGRERTRHIGVWEVMEMEAVFTAASGHER